MLLWPSLFRRTGRHPHARSDGIGIRRQRRGEGAIMLRSAWRRGTGGQCGLRPLQHTAAATAQKHPLRPSFPRRPHRCAPTKRRRMRRRRRLLLKMQARRAQRRRRLRVIPQPHASVRLPSLRVGWCILLCPCISPDVQHTCSILSCVRPTDRGRFARRACLKPQPLLLLPP
jgi:hypothetical protein